MKVCLASVIAATMLLASDKECQSDRDKIAGCVEKEYYSNGRLSVEIPYKDSKMNGVGKFYYENGGLKAEIPAKDDKRDGVGKWYYENSKLKAEIPFKNDKANGVAKAYYSSSEPFADVVYNNGEITSAKCHNGSIPTNAQLHNFSKSGELSDLCGETPR